MIFNYLSGVARPYVLAVATILIAALVAFSVFKIIILAQVLAAEGVDRHNVEVKFKK